MTPSPINQPEAKPLASGDRVRACFPFCSHVSEAEILEIADLGADRGFIVRLDKPLPTGWVPNKTVRVPAQNIEPL